MIATYPSLGVFDGCDERLFVRGIVLEILTNSQSDRRESFLFFREPSGGHWEICRLGPPPLTL